MASRDWEQAFSNWTGAEGTVEEEKAQVTLRRVRNAIANSPDLAAQRVDVYPKGSYPNRTNVVRDSDIDIAVELASLATHRFEGEAAGLTMEALGIERYSGTYRWMSFKDHVEAALVAEFGRQLVERGNKAIRVKATNSTIPADVVPCETLILHTSPTHSIQGIEITPDRGRWISNFPAQHKEQGLAKNQRTYKRYKRTVRILKRLENEMVRERVIEVVPSFLIESMVWNVGNPTLTGSRTWAGTVRAVIIEAYKQTETDASADDLREANAFKYLFRPWQAWTRQQGNDFLQAAWDYVGFG